MSDQNEKAYACPFCGTELKVKNPDNCKMCGNNLRGLDLSEVQNEGLVAGLETVTKFTRQAQEDMKNRKKWYNEDLQKKHKETNVEWDDPFATNYQRENNMTVDESLDEIEEFTRLANASEFDEAAWKNLMDKYNSRSGKHENNLPVNEMFMQKLQEDREKKDKKNGKGSNTEVSRKFGGASAGGGASMRGATETNPETEKRVVKKGNGMVPDEAAKKMFINKNSGNGAAALAKYANKKNAPKKLW